MTTMFEPSWLCHFCGSGFVELKFCWVLNRCVKIGFLVRAYDCFLCANVFGPASNACKMQSFVSFLILNLISPHLMQSSSRVVLVVEWWLISCNCRLWLDYTLFQQLHESLPFLDWDFYQEINNDDWQGCIFRLTCSHSELTKYHEPSWEMP